jgi:GNAT superfamily N-acetyltransferase
MTQLRTLLAFSVADELDEASERKISEGLDAYNDEVAPPRNWAPLWIVGRDDLGEAQAGLRAVTFFDWLSISLLWVAEPFRRKGVGSRMLAEAEAVARSRGAANAYLDTFTFQAPGFYKKQGYREFARLEGLPPGHSRIWYLKRL